MSSPHITVPQFVVGPASGSAPGVVVLHEGSGIGPQVLRFAQRLAGEGYMIACPDLFYRVGGTGAIAMEDLMASLEPAEVEADIVGTGASLRSQGAPSVAVIGFCLGGSLSYRMAVDTHAFDASFGFYGSSAPRALGDPNCPMQMVYGENDPWVSKDEVARFVARHPGTIVYPDAGHGFMRDGSDDYHEASATDAWQRLLAFLSQHLKRP